MVKQMKKILITILSIAVIFIFFVACSSTSKLNDEQKKMLDVVMDNITMWETKENKFATHIQLQKTDGTYYLCVGYSSDKVYHTNEAISSYVGTMSHAYEIEANQLTDAGANSMIVPAEMFMWGGVGTGRELIGNSTWYYDDTYEEKYDQMKDLFLNLVEEE